MNWRDYSDVPLSVYVDEFTRVDSPMLGEAATIREAAKPHSALALAMMWVEQRYASYTESPIPADFYNPLSLAKPDGSTLDGINRWMHFWSYAEGVHAWKDRITSQTYKAGIYARTVTLADLVRVYAPPNDNNNTNDYIDAVQALLQKWPRITQEAPPVATIPMKTVEIAGLGPVQIPADIEFEQRIIPWGQWNQRPGKPMTGGKASYWIQHETGNERPSTGADNHSRYMDMGAPDADGNSQMLGYHFTVDDHKIIQKIPVSEVSWQAADGAGPGNMDSVSCEACVNSDGDETRMRRNAEWLAAAVCKGLGLGRAQITRHYDRNAHLPPSQRHICPQHMIEQGYWPTFVNNVVAHIEGDETIPEQFAPPMPIDLAAWDGTDRTLPDGTKLYAVRRMVSARTKTRRLQVAAAGAKPIGPDLKKGDEAEVLYVFQPGNKGSRYYLTPYWTRLRASHFTPYVTVADAA